MKYRLTVEVETKNMDGDLLSIANTDRSKWKVIGATPIYETTGGTVTGSQFQKTETISTPQSPVNG